jgi:hypothetical protein
MHDWTFFRGNSNALLAKMAVAMETRGVKVSPLLLRRGVTKNNCFLVFNEDLCYYARLYVIQKTHKHDSFMYIHATENHGGTCVYARAL